MCGIIGVISKENRDDLGKLIALGLYQQQNRGDHSAGIATIKKLPFSRVEYRRNRASAVGEGLSDFNPLAIRQGKGEVADIFSEEDFNNLTGFMGIGQVRYPTTGYVIDNSEQLSEKEKQKMILSSIQPLQAPHYKVAMVHNGDVNPDSYHEIIAQFEKEGLRKVTHNDLEAILKVFTRSFFDQTENVPNNQRVAKAVSDIFEKVKGTYSVGTIINNVGLLMFRDPNGRRPLFTGITQDKNGEITNYAFASETVALEKMLFKGTLQTNRPDIPFIHDEVKPGELVFISKDFKIYREQIASPDLKMCPFEAAYFMRPSSFFNGERVKQIRRNIINNMWQEFKSKPAYKNLMENKDNIVVVPVPRTAESAAVYLQHDAGLKYINAIEKHPHSARIFMQPTQEHRERETISDHFIYKEEIKGKDIILIDDSIVRGTTMKRIIKYMKDVGANSVHVFITFPHIINPCMHAIDFHTKEELYSHGKYLYEMKKGLGLNNKDTLLYSTPEIMKKSIGTNKLCNECYAK